MGAHKKGSVRKNGNRLTYRVRCQDPDSSFLCLYIVSMCFLENMLHFTNSDLHYRFGNLVLFPLQDLARNRRV